MSRVLTEWTAPVFPAGDVLETPLVRLTPLVADAHAAVLFAAIEGHDDLWRWMAAGPFHGSAGFHRWMREIEGRSDPLFYAIEDRSLGRFTGMASYMRIDRAHGVIEIGNILLSPLLQRTRTGSVALMTMIARAFAAGYRRVEWKCNARNLPSRRAAQRLGFSYEGVFRNHMVIKGENRDTAWFAITDTDWPALNEAYAAWTAPANFKAAGQQVERLGDLTRLVRVASDPALDPARNLAQD
jgi:RimJ/RimL family protein N-acetyltransferase